MLIGVGLVIAALAVRYVSDVAVAEVIAAIGVLLILLAAVRAWSRFNWFSMGTRDSTLYGGRMARTVCANPFARWLYWIDADGNDRDGGQM